MLVNIRTYLFLASYKLWNYRKEKLFIFTDSRGFEITKIKNRKSPFSTYLLHFVKHYCCDVFICPEKHTTIYDFLYKYDSYKHKPYKRVIAHIGVVDFSPRPKSTIAGILALKEKKIVHIMGKEFYQKYQETVPYPQQYAGEQTAAILTTEQLPEIAAKFNDIQNLIWISCNPVDTGWRGNYKKDRPDNINMVNEKSLIFKDFLTPEVSIIDLTAWSFDEVHNYTCDNIHLSEKGMKYIETALKKLIQE